MECTGADAALLQLPASLQRQLAFERFHLHKPDMFFKNLSRDPAFDPRYLPQNCGAIELPCYWIARRHLHVFGHQEHVSHELPFFLGDGPNDSVLFPIHPTSRPHYAELFAKLGARDAAREGLHIWAVPTASTRTFLAWPDQVPEQALFVKTTLHSPVLGDRRLYKWKVARSVGLSQQVRDGLATLPAGLGYFPETFGLVPRQMPDSGVIVRSIPEEIKADRLLVAPLFALMGGQQSRPLLLTLLDQAALPAEQFIEEVLCEKFAALWLELALQHGLILEAHGQDLMLALSPDLTRVERFYYRDFEGMQVDWALRRRKGLMTAASLPNAHAWHETYGTWGYRYGQLLWYKLRISLLQYLHAVLTELEQMLRAWQDRGLLRGPRIEEGDLTAMFSRKMLAILDERFAVRVAEPYNIHRRLNRFVLLLMNLRKELLGAEASMLP
jgi:hypothetical protein